MDLYTVDEHQRKQYNILLCCIGIIISQYYNLKILSIDARSPITLYMFSKYFNCDYHEFIHDDHESFEHLIKDKHITMELCNEYFEKTDQILIEIKMNDDNIEKAKQLYHHLLEHDSKLKCP
jgi:hypothetical protein